MPLSVDIRNNNLQKFKGWKRTKELQEIIIF